MKIRISTKGIGVMILNIYLTRKPSAMVTAEHVLICSTRDIFATKFPIHTPFQMDKTCPIDNNNMGPIYFHKADVNILPFPISCNDNLQEVRFLYNSKLQSNTNISAFLCQRSFGYLLNSRVIFSFHKLGNSLKT